MSLGRRRRAAFMLHLDGVSCCGDILSRRPTYFIAPICIKQDIDDRTSFKDSFITALHHISFLLSEFRDQSGFRSSTFSLVLLSCFHRPGLSDLMLAIVTIFLGIQNCSRDQWRCSKFGDVAVEKKIRTPWREDGRLMLILVSALLQR